MTKRILCPTDGSAHSDLALAAAVELAGKYGAELWVCVVNVLHGGGRGPMVPHWTDEEVDKILSGAVAAAEAKGVTVHPTIVTDREAASGIVDHAEVHEIDHIVMGTGDKRGFSRLMLGSVAADVAARAHCSVTIAR